MESPSFFKELIEIGKNSPYYQVRADKDPCERCQAHHRAIYRVLGAEEGVNLPPFHPNCKCSISGYNTEVHGRADPWQAETLLWLDILYGEEDTEADKLKKLMAFYPQASEATIRRALTQTEEITNIHSRIEAFIGVLSDTAVMTAESLEAFGWVHATQEEADRLNAAFAKYNITSRESIIQFMAIAAAETGYGEAYLERGDDAYWESKGYDRYTRGAGYLQLTHAKKHREFLAFIGDDFSDRDTASYIAENYPLESALWFGLPTMVSGRASTNLSTRGWPKGETRLLFSSRRPIM